MDKERSAGPPALGSEEGGHSGRMTCPVVVKPVGCYFGSDS